MQVSPLFCKNRQKPLGHPTGQSSPKSNFFCQENLTKKIISLENRDTYKFFSKMEINEGRLPADEEVGKTTSGKKIASPKVAMALAGALAAATSPALAEDNTSQIQLAAATSSTSQQVDCVAFVKDQREIAADSGVKMSRKDQKSLLHQCRSGELQARIAEQKKILAEFDKEIEALNLRRNEQNQILDANGQAIAQIVAINDQWVIQRKLNSEIAQIQENIDGSVARQEEMLREAERILQRLATS